MKEYAEVIVDITADKLDRPFTYRIPGNLKERAVLGSAVRIPFGRGGRLICGYIVGFSDHTDLEESKIREISEITAGEETAETRLLSLAAWMSRNYGSTMIQALKTVIPVRKQYSEVTEKIVSLASPEDAEVFLSVCRRKKWKAKERVISALIECGELKLSELEKKAEVTAAVVNGLIETGVLEMSVSGKFRQVIKDAETFPPDKLGDEQQKAVEMIRREWENADRPVLLEGVTGSGKTVVYTELIADILAEGKQAIVLIPEIALTWQTVLRFVRRFGTKVSFLHSRLSGGERYDQMKAAKSGAVSVMVGPRSALFTPFSNLGLIIIDEEHEETYHSETVPRYHARETAIERGKLEHAHVLFGSATPSITAKYRAEQGTFLRVLLKSRFGSSVLPTTEIVDMRKELEAGNRSIISDRLKERIDAALSRHEQVMLFLNRRGFTGCVTCRNCGFVVKCPHCDVSMTRHKNGKLICHYCGYEQKDLNRCPDCGSSAIGGLTIGTEQVEEITARTFPGAMIMRMDADTTKGKDGHEKILTRFASGEADILIGTQMIVKGHDFPNVTVVGILLADLSLNESDYRSAEHTFSLIAQAVGRAGRGMKKGNAVIQTYQPEHYAVISAAGQDPEEFYKEEISYRKILEYPPVGCMAAICGAAKDENLLSTGMHYIRKYIERIDPGNVLLTIGPAPESVGKIRDYYRQVIYIRNNDHERLVRAVSMIADYISVNSGFANIRIQFDLT